MIVSVLACCSLLLLGAHALRFGDLGLTAFYAALAGLALSRRAWVRWAAAGVVVHGLAVWIGTGLDLVEMRRVMGQPWLRMAMIMGGVVLVSALSAALLLWQGRRYDRGREQGLALGAVFLLTTGLLFLTRSKVPFPILLADRYFPEWGGLEVLLLGFYAVWVGSKMLVKKKTRTLRPRIWALFSFVFFLQLGLGLMGLEQMLMTGQLHLPVPALIVGGPIFRGGGLFMLILFFTTIVLVGPAWCSHLCYIGAWDDQASRLGGNRPERGFPGPWHKGRLVTLIGTIAVAAGLRLFGVSGAVAVWVAAAFGLGGVMLMLSASRRRGTMTHCTTYCPMGLVANVLGRISPWRVRINANCTNCLTCTKFCRYGALDEQTIADRTPGLTCTLCGDCVSICPHAAAQYCFPGLSSQVAKAAFLVIVISLHTLFLGVARI